MHVNLIAYAVLLVKVHRRELTPEKRTPEIGNEKSSNAANLTIKLLLYLFEFL
jgi:hypothetical protein